MRYHVILEESEEGFSASVPSLPGCHSHGRTEQDALETIADAIREYLEVVREENPTIRVREVDVEAQPAEKKSWPCQPGSAKHIPHSMAPDFNAPLEDFREYME